MTTNPLVSNSDASIEQRLMAMARGQKVPNKQVIAPPPQTPKKKNQFTQFCSGCGAERRVLFDGRCALCAPIKERPRRGRKFLTDFYRFLLAQSNRAINAHRKGNGSKALRINEQLHAHILEYGEALRACQIVEGKRR